MSRDTKTTDQPPQTAHEKTPTGEPGTNTPKNGSDTQRARSVLFLHPPQGLAASSARDPLQEIYIDFSRQVVDVLDTKSKLRFSCPLSNVIEFRPFSS
jgi:hypothetical protein